MSLNETSQYLLSQPIVLNAIHKLQNELPPNLYYHVPSHTEDVLNEVILFANEDKLDSRSLLLLVIGAAYHDLGFIVSEQNNEYFAAKFAIEAMRENGSFTNQEIEEVSLMISDTQVKQTSQGPRQIAQGRLSGYLLDADLSNLGREDFFEKSELVRKELNIPANKDYLVSLLNFISAHSWNTPAAHRLRQAKKISNIAILKAKLGNI